MQLSFEDRVLLALEAVGLAWERNDGYLCPEDLEQIAGEWSVEDPEWTADDWRYKDLGSDRERLLGMLDFALTNHEDEV